VIAQGPVAFGNGPQPDRDLDAGTEYTCLRAGQVLGNV
jgi:hypothetical protein